MFRLLIVVVLTTLCACGHYEAHKDAHDGDHGGEHAEGEGHDADADVDAEHADGDHDEHGEHGREDRDEQGAAGFHALEVANLEGATIDLGEYAGEVCLVVNVASECGYTPQYKGLQQLHEEMAVLGVNVLGFPSNEFGGQEPGSSEEIREFCTDRFGVSFPMFAKLETQAGEGQSSLYALLGEATGELPNWNFCKYLVGKDGTPIAFFKSNVEPDSAELRAAIGDAL